MTFTCVKLETETWPGLRARGDGAAWRRRLAAERESRAREDARAETRRDEEKRAVRRAFVEKQWAIDDALERATRVSSSNAALDARAAAAGFEDAIEDARRRGASPSPVATARARVHRRHRAHDRHPPRARERVMRTRDGVHRVSSVARPVVAAPPPPSLSSRAPSRFLPPLASSRDMADARVVRASFRALLRAARRLEAQAARTTAGRVFTEEEVAELERIAPARGAEAMRDASRARDVVRREFRGASTDEAHLAERLDASLVALGIARRRARRLEDMASETTSETTTEGVRVRVKASLVPSQTSPEVNRYVYAYDVEITNVGNDEAVQVVSREWRVVDEDGNVEFVQGRGVVGEQPVLGVGESFHYSSACALRRIRGTMRGKYVCATQESKRVFEAEIGAFALMPPRKGASELTVDEDEDEDDEGEDEDLKALTRDSAINIR